MKRLLLSAAIALPALCAFADLGDDGYYRVQNAYTKRYAYLLDNKGSISGGEGTVDVQALQLYLDIKNAVSDPSTVFFLQKANGTGSNLMYDIAGQGTSVHGFLGEYVKIIKGKEYDGQQAYYVSASKSGMTKYLGDRWTDRRDPQGLASADCTGDRRLWYIHPMDAGNDEAYFGVSPTLTAGGKYYYPMYAAFPFNANSDGMKFYTVTDINPYDEVPAVGLKELHGVVPAGTPVIIECSNPLASENRLNVGPEGSKADIAGNQLKGVYFKNDDVVHMNRVKYDRNTMRILTVKDGRLVFDVADLDYLPRNQAYLQLNSDTQYGVKTYKVVSEEEYKEHYDAVETISVDAAVDVYSLDGRLVKSGISRGEVDALGKGMYILRSGTAMEKLIVR